MLIQILFTLAFVSALVMTWRRHKQSAIAFPEAILWSLLWIAAGIIVWWPGFATFLANSVGVGRGADLVIYSSLILIFWLMFRIFVRLEAMERKITDVVRNEALQDLEKHVK